MWNFIYQLASPKSFYRISGTILPWLKCSTLALFAVGILWALIVAPADYQQGDAFRIIYLHVPAAFMSLAIYAYMAFLAVLVLVWRIKMASLLIPQCAFIGAIMTFLALVTGSIWGKPMWGTWWIWDARLTSELVLLFLYLGILGTNSAILRQSQAQKAVAILTLVGFVDIPIIHYSVYWWNTLHQGASLSLMAKPKIAAPMLYPLIVMIFGFFSYFLLSLILLARIQVLQKERKSRWVQKLIAGGEL
jgi:heme exporter protein C